MPATRHAQRLAIVDSRGNRDIDGAVLGKAATPTAVRAGLLGNPAATAAARARLLPHHLAERRAHDLAQLAGAVAVGAGDDRRPRRGTRALALLARDDEFDGNLDGLADRRLGERQLDRDARVGTGLGARLPEATEPSARAPEQR